jgi:hypothetical protein
MCYARAIAPREGPFGVMSAEDNGETPTNDAQAVMA